MSRGTWRGYGTSNDLLVAADGDHQRKMVLSAEPVGHFGLLHRCWVGGFAAAREGSYLSMPVHDRPLLQMRLPLVNYHNPLRVEEVEAPYRESLSSRDMAGDPSLEVVAVDKKEVVLQEAHILMTDDSAEVQREHYTGHLTKTMPGLGVDQEEPDTSPLVRYCAAAAVVVAAAAAAAANVDSTGCSTLNYVDLFRRKALKSYHSPSPCPLVS